MRSVYIKYNPYTVMTEVKIDGEPVKQNSELNVGEERLQMWVEKLPEILVDECNTKDFELKFYGTKLDYDDVVSVAEAAKNDGINIRCEHIAAKEVKDKEETISEIFRDIQAGPFEELKQDDVVNAFEMAKSEEFPVNVIATMSAGKSTLINALLSKKLMPSKQEACTAIITEIKDVKNKNFYAKVYDNTNKKIEEYLELTLDKMKQLNSNPEVSLIRTEGNIPFVDSQDTALLLIDTPGPNNSHNPEHKAVTYEMIKKSAKTLVLYVMDAGGLRTDDDNNLLSYVADSMKVGGKQSKDRFMFVVNKLDEYSEEDDSVEAALEHVREYLEDKGIKNPNIYPTSALTALNIRTLLNEIDVDDAWNSGKKTIKQTALDVETFNITEDLHLEKYAPLPPSVREKINEMLEEARENGDKKQEALIHTGIISIEMAIKMYVEKYAKTAKIKSIVDTFDKRLESAQTFENAKQTIAKNEDKHGEISAQIQNLKRKISDGENAKTFKKKIMGIDYDEEIRKLIEGITQELQSKVTEQIESCKELGDISKDKARDICSSFAKDVERLQAKVKVNLENAVTLHMKKSAEVLLEQYKNRLASLVQDIPIGDITISPFELINGNINSLGNTEVLIDQLAERKLIREGHEISKYNHWWDYLNPFKWFQSPEYTDDVYDDRVDASKLAQQCFGPIRKQLKENNKKAVEYTKEQVNEIKEIFIKKFDELDRLLKDKLTKLNTYTSEERNIKGLITESKKKLEWLENIQARIKSILDI